MSASSPAAGSRFTLGRDFTNAALLAAYANGRLLSAEDLSTDQRTLAARDQWIGRAAGAGVVDGLTVTASATTVTVAPGLGLTGTGEPVVLNQRTSLPLAVPLAEATTPSDPGKFGCCGTPSTGSTALVGAGSYVLSARPAAQSQGGAATAAAPGAAGGGGCVAAWTAAGVEFRVTTLPVGTTVAGVTMTTDNRRNLVATWTFGVEQRAALAAGPFEDPQPDWMELAGIEDLDLPLAVLAWDGQSIADLDLWSVRRRITFAADDGDTWGLLTSDRRISEGQARSRQFQDQVAELVRKQVAEKITAAITFPVLPPVGFLPLGTSDQEAFTTAAMERLDRLEERDDQLDAPAAPAPAEEVPEGAPAQPPPAPPPPAEAAPIEGGAEAAPRGFQPVDEARMGLTDRLPLGAGDLLLITRAFAAAGGSGFGLQTFFGRTARFGGIIDFELAELALRESWYRPPLDLPQHDLDDDGDDQAPRAGAGAEGGGKEAQPQPDIAGRGPGGVGDPQQPDLPGASSPPITIYLVRENLVALASKGLSKRARLLKRMRGLPTVAGPYVVFVVNYRWYSDATPPGTLIRTVAQIRR